MVNYKNENEKDEKILLQYQNHVLMQKILSITSTSTLVYKKLENVEKPFEKVCTNCRTIFSIKRNTFEERYDIR